MIRKSFKSISLEGIKPGTCKRIRISAGESYTGATSHLPVMICRGKKPGPTLGITAAVHGDEINGTGAIRHLIRTLPESLEAGNLILVPVINLLGFERHSRYMPDRRDLNRAFPGNVKGSISARLAYLVTQEIISRCDCIIDLHTAAMHRTNFPNIRADMLNESCASLARNFGCEIIVDNQGPEGSLRRLATDSGCPTIVVEAGEVSKIEPSVQEMMGRGIQNTLIAMGMQAGEIMGANHTLVVKETRWVRATNGGMLAFHCLPGDTVTKDQPLASSTDLLGAHLDTILSPHDGIILGMTTMPAVSPGDPVAHIAKPDTSRQFTKLARNIDALDDETLEQQVRDHLATNMTLDDAPDDFTTE